MREENSQTPSADDDSDVTLVTPLFDDVAAVTAQPVVPLAASPQPSAVSYRTANAPGYSFVPVRRSAIISLVLISSIIGGVVGGLALRFYQKRQSASAASAPSATKQASAPVVESPSSPQPAEPTQQTEATQQAASNDGARQQTVAAQIPADEAPTALEESVEASPPPPPATTHEASKEERNAGKTSEPRRASNASEEKHDQIVKPSKDEERDARRDEARAERSAPRSRRLERPSESRANAPERNEPRLFGTIVGAPERRPRRERVRTPEPSRDRVRAIFEGQP